jgi:hypothetical protein
VHFAQSKNRLSYAQVIYFKRIILGIRPTAPRGRAFIIDPKPCGLTKASGAESTPYGPLTLIENLPPFLKHTHAPASSSTVSFFQLISGPAESGCSLPDQGK